MLQKHVNDPLLKIYWYTVEALMSGQPSGHKKGAETGCPLQEKYRVNCMGFSEGGRE